ncbi:type III secretion system export apparatus subunit SctU [Pacificimonas sp. WHA3]|uniref:Type III secretion system export apparatus subunit SctU n=1 Tax=Pacificimonas pallii TaxID=2827236 RepID=A0ABS6SF12_9SPHN|nr:type III secretion system export apparatus subunit SctU [Pacificimonas pallii]MBV7256960.1 type III secretion system export apparatus subunit SctU [Pacificimonas pallii]
MADNKDGGDKTEKPTNKRLRDARKKGDVPKSREVSSTLGLIGWLAVAAVTIGYAGSRLGGMFESVFVYLANPDVASMARLGDEAFWTLLAVSAAIILPVAAIGALVEFLQVGPVATTEKMKPDLSRLNPIDGFKRMFSMDNLVEVVKAILKTIILLAIGALITWGMMRDTIGLIRADAGAALMLSWDLIFAMLAWTAGIFIIVSAADAAYQKSSFIKKMKMSRRDIKQEMKDIEGDPMIKMKRRQLHQEWASQNAAGAVRQATALVVNPTHIAVALLYDEAESPVPSVIAKGEDMMALAMREAAEEAGVPILRNVDLARALNARVTLEDLIPADLFDAVAQVIVWAQQVRGGVQPEEPDIILAEEARAPEDQASLPPPSGG